MPHTASLKDGIVSRIATQAPFGVWTPADFLDLGSRDAVDKTLQRLARAGVIRRIARGLYDKPKTSSLTGGLTTPDYRQIIDAIARRDQARMLISGMTAANDLHLTTAVPSRVVIHTDVRRRSIRLGNLVIQFKVTAPSRLYWAGRPAMRVVQALHWLRDVSADQDPTTMNRLIAILKHPSQGAAIRADLRDGLPTLPAWMQPIARQLLGASSNEEIEDDDDGSIARRHNSAMNVSYLEILRADDADRRGLFLAAAERLGTAVQHIEKDFWVCWTLDAMFNGLSNDSPRLLFKGGTSLSKSFGLIDRFSEDIDITVFRDDLGQPATFAELEALSGKKRQRRLDAIKASCQAYISGPLLGQLNQILIQTLLNAGIARDRARIVVDDADADRQTLLFWYPSALTEAREYISPAVQIEAGAKSALDPHQATTDFPYVASDVARLDLRVQNVTTVNPERTFWDKVIILHGQRRWFERRGVLRADGHRVSRHYYDVYRLMRSEVGPRAVGDRELAIDCAHHARTFFNSADLDLAHAVPGTLALFPPKDMREALRRDYDAMSGMIFGAVPPFADVLTSIEELETQVNAE